MKAEKNTVPKIDAIDKKLIEELQNNCKQSIKQLADKVNLSVSPTHERIKKIEESGIIKGYIGLVDPQTLGKNLTVYCQVTLVKHQEKYLNDFEKYVSDIDEIIEVAYVTGDYDFLLKILLEDMNEYQDFIIKKISQLDIISNIKSTFVIKQSKNTNKIKI